jgi:polyisoprenoid-binding protein YceI
VGPRGGANCFTNEEERIETMSQTSPQPSEQTSTWDIDPVHSTVEFKVKHMMIANVRGHFSKVSGVLTHDESDVTKSKVEASIEASSIDTRDDQRDAHLRSADFLDVENHPWLTFVSTRVSKSGIGECSVEGDLTIRGVTRRVTFNVEGPTPPAKDPWGNIRIAVSANTKINRKDFGLTWNTALETGGILVGDEVTITLDAEFVKS